MGSTPPADGGAAADSIGSLLTRLRLARGFSQLRLAEHLCAASGQPTVSRHEVSRWEREERVPGRFWLGWLAVVLDAPLADLESAAALRRQPAAPVTADGRLWHPPSASDLLATLECAAVDDVRPMAHAWLAGATAPGTTPVREPTGPPDPDAPDPTRLDALRRMDDLVGGADLADHVDRELRAALAALQVRTGRRALQLVAGWAQLAGWVHADAGDPLRAQRAWVVALRAAAAAGDRLLAGYVLSSFSHQRLSAGQPQDALLLARTAYSGTRHRASALCRALLLHRVALAAARAGERRAAHTALAAAEAAGQRARREREPRWLYWLDEAELTAMSGRALAALGRPMRAAPLLAAVPGRGGPRTHAVYAGWLARTYLDLGEVERACEVAAGAWVGAVRAGSARAAAGLRQLHPLLLRHDDVPAVRGYRRLAVAAADYLPTARSGTPWLTAARQHGSVAL